MEEKQVEVIEMGTKEEVKKEKTPQIYVVMPKEVYDKLYAYLTTEPQPMVKVFPIVNMLDLNAKAMPINFTENK